MLHKPNNCVKFQNFLSKNIKIIPDFVFKNVELSHFQAQERKCENMEIAQGVLGNDALVSQTFSINLLCMFYTRHRHIEKNFHHFFLPKNEH